MRGTGAHTVVTTGCDIPLRTLDSALKHIKHKHNDVSKMFNEVLLFCQGTFLLYHLAIL